MIKLMTKMLLLSLSVLAVALPSYAKSSMRDDLVGDWLCESRHEDNHAEGIMRLYPNGKGVELIEYIDKDLPPYYSYLDMTSLTYDWHVKDSKLYMSNQKINEYHLYDFTDNGLVRWSDMDIADAKAEYERLLNAYNWNIIEFDGKDKHRYTFEDGSFGECRRLK